MLSPTSVKRKLQKFILTRKSPRLQAKQKDLNTDTTPTTPKGHSTKRKPNRNISDAFEPPTKKTYCSNEQYDKLIELTNIIPGLSYRIRLSEDNSSYLEICRKVACVSPDGVPYETSRVVTCAKGETYFQALNSSPELHCNIFNNDGSVDEVHYKTLLDRLSPKWHFCWGIPKDVYQNNAEYIRYTPKSYNERNYPFPAVCSVTCQKWFEGPKKGKVQTLDNGPVCRECMTFLRNTKFSNKRNSKVTAKQKESRTDVSSHYPMGLLSPASRTKRMSATRFKRGTDKKKISALREKLAETTVMLEEEQNKEMNSIADIINRNYKDDLDKIFKEAEKKKGTQSRELLEEIWQRDCSDRQKFYEDQSKNSEFLVIKIYGLGVPGVVSCCLILGK